MANKLFKIMVFTVNIIAIWTLYRLYESTHNIFWWGLLIFVIFNFLASETVKTATNDLIEQKSYSDPQVIALWAKITMLTSFLCLILSVIGLVLSFN